MSRYETFNILAKAKIQTLVTMTKEYHPDWTNKEIEKFLQGAIESTIKKEASS